jgi:hypothetical protein
MLVLPLISVVAEASMLSDAGALMSLIGKWFTFWAVGVRLFSAGVMQSLRPQFTAESIFAIKDQSALPRARSWFRQSGDGESRPCEPHQAGLGGAGCHCRRSLLRTRGHRPRDAKRAQRQGMVALVSDFGIFLVLAAIVASRLLVIPAQAAIQ